MDRSFLIVPCACAWFFGIASTVAHADTSLTFNGRVLSGTCDVHADEMSKLVKLPPMRTDEIVGIVDAPVTTSETPFDLRFENCRGVRLAHLAFSGTSATPSSAQYANTGDAQGVALHLVESATGKVIDATGFDVSLTVTGGTASYSAKAYYFRLGSLPVGAGLFDSTAMVTVSYD